MTKWHRITWYTAKICLVLLLSGTGLHALHAKFHSHSEGSHKPCVVCKLHSLPFVTVFSEPLEVHLTLVEFILYYPNPSISLKSSQQAHLPRAPPSIRLA